MTATRADVTRIPATPLAMLARSWRLGAFVAVFVLFSVLAPNFLSRANWLNTSTYATDALILGLGETLVIITGGVDLSVGALLGVASAIGAVFLEHHGGSLGAITVAAVLAIGAATALGLVSGLLIGYLRISPFIATLGMLGIGTGATDLITHGVDIQIPASISPLGNGVWFDWLPVVVFIALILCVVMRHVLKHTRFGLHTYAIGSDREAARRCGVNVPRHLLSVYGVSGALAGVAGYLELARNVVGSPTAGQNAELDAIAAVAIGGASLSGGSGTVGGTLVGAAILAMVETGLILLGLSPSWQTVAAGVVIVAAVLIQQAIRGESRARLRSRFQGLRAR